MPGARAHTTRTTNGSGYVESVTHDYIRHDTTTLFAALNAATGEIIAQCKPRHRHQELISFLNHIDKAVPAALYVHMILDNYATHKHPTVKAWLDKRLRYHMHFTPTYSSWINQVERWFGLITQQAIRRGSSESVRQLVLQIQRYVEHYNVHKRPFVWTVSIRSSPKSSAYIKLFLGRNISRDGPGDRRDPAAVHAAG